jgi:hypothetical protein
VEVKALRALTCIAKSPQGAQAVLDGGALYECTTLLTWPPERLNRVQWCELLARLASHDTFAAALLVTQRCPPGYAHACLAGSEHWTHSFNPPSEVEAEYFDDAFHRRNHHHTWV